MTEFLNGSIHQGEIWLPTTEGRDEVLWPGILRNFSIAKQTCSTWWLFDPGYRIDCMGSEGDRMVRAGAGEQKEQIKQAIGFLHFSH